MPQDLEFKLKEICEHGIRMRGIDEPSKDLETWRQILEALQLKGLLHSQKPSHQINHRNCATGDCGGALFLLPPSSSPFFSVPLSLLPLPSGFCSACLFFFLN